MFDPRCFNFLSAFLAITEFVNGYGSQSGFRLCNFHTAPAFRRLGHRLLLKSVHPAETSDGLLIERDCFSLLCRSVCVSLQSGYALFQPDAKAFELQLCKHRFDPGFPI